MSYPFPPELQQLLHEGIAAGYYRNEDEMLLKAVQLLREHDTHLEEFENNLKMRIDRLDRGEGIQLENDDALREFFDDIQTRGSHRYKIRRSGK